MCTSPQTQQFFSLVLLQHLPKPTTVLKRSSLTWDSCIEADPRMLRHNLRRKGATSKAEDNMHMKIKWAQYKYHHDKIMRFKAKFVHKQWVFSEKAPSTCSRSRAAEMATASCNELQPRKTGRFGLPKCSRIMQWSTKTVLLTWRL